MGSGWTMAGVRQSGRHPAELPLALEAIRLWAGLADDLGADLEYRRLGNLRLARDETEVAAIRALYAETPARPVSSRVVEMFRRVDTPHFRPMKGGRR